MTERRSLWPRRKRDDGTTQKINLTLERLREANRQNREAVEELVSNFPPPLEERDKNESA